MTAPNLLGLDEESIAWRDLLVQVSRLAARLSMVGNPAPYVERVGKRLRHPEVGDYVYEVSSRWRLKRKGEERPLDSGYLLRVVNEPSWTPEEYAEELKIDPDAKLPTEDVWYIQYGPSEEDVCRWRDCRFQVVPLDAEAFE